MPEVQPSRSNKPRNTDVYAGQNTLLWTVWFTYGAFYFCRSNISVAVPFLKSTVEDGGLGLTVDQVGYILGATKIAYALGQLLNGQLAEQLSPRKLLALGMLGTAALNVAFGFGTAFYFLLFVWACNGYSQSLGWTPCVRIMANWFPVRLRGKAVGLIGTGYLLSASVTWLIASYAADSLGWRSAFLVPSVMMTCSAIVMWLFMKESPQESGVGNALHLAEVPLAAGTGRNPLYDNFLLTITNPKLWMLGISLGLLNATRYGFLDWGLSHLVDLKETTNASSAIEPVGVFREAVKYAVLPLGGIGGALIAGWATDRFFGSRRAPVACLLLVTLGLLTLVYDDVARASIPATVILLGVIGFCIFGPQVLLVGTAPADLARKGTSAAAAGFVNSLGYIGAASGDIITGLSLKFFNWEFTIYLWALWAFAAAIAVGLLWNATADESDDTISTS